MCVCVRERCDGKLYDLLPCTESVFFFCVCAQVEEPTSGSSEKTSWPELLGVPGEEAKTKILADNPKLEVIILLVGSIVTTDYREDRVRVYVDDEGKVAQIPKIG